jgi:O-antigen/teichoic acid export membrane protein
LKGPLSKAGVGWLTVGNLVEQGSRLIVSIIVAQLLGPGGRGVVALISVLDEVSSATFTLGIPIAAGFRAKLGLDTDQSLVNASLVSGLLLTPLTLVVGLGVGLLALDGLSEGTKWMGILLIAWTGAVNMPSLVAMNLLQAHRQLGQLAIYRAIFGLTSLVAIAALAVASHLSAPLAVASFLLARLVTAGYGLRATKWPKSLRVHAPLKPLFRYGLKATPGTIGMLLNNKVDQLVIAPFVSIGDLGLYAVAAGTSFAPATFGMSMGASAFATVTHDAARGRAGSAATAIRHGLLVTGLIAAILAAVSPMLVPLVYGSSFRGAIVPTLILLMGSVPWGGQLVATQCANALGKPSYASTSELVGLAVTVLGLFIFVPTYGIVAASIVSSIAYTVRLAVTLLLLRRVGVRHIVPGFDDVAWLGHRLMREVRIAAS